VTTKINCSVCGKHLMDLDNWDEDVVCFDCAEEYLDKDNKEDK